MDFLSFCQRFSKSYTFFSSLGSKRMEAKHKRKKNFFWGTQPNKKPDLERMAQTPRPGTGDSVGRCPCYRCSTLINYDSNCLMCGTFLIKLLSPSDNRGISPKPKETYDSDLSATFFDQNRYLLLLIFYDQVLYVQNSNKNRMAEFEDDISGHIFLGRVDFWNLLARGRMPAHKHCRLILPSAGRP